MWTQTNSTSGWSVAIRLLGLGERLQPLAREAVREHRHEDVDPRAAEQVERLADVALDRLDREDACELGLQLLGGLPTWCWVTGSSAWLIAASLGIDADLCRASVTMTSISVNMRRVKPIATLASACPPLLAGPLDADEAEQPRAAR